MDRAIRQPMTTIFNIENGQCSVANQSAFDQFKQHATDVLVQAVNEVYATLPIDHEALARSYAETLFTPENICTTLAPEISTPLSQSNARRAEFFGERTMPNVARQHGVVARRDVPVSTNNCPVSYDGHANFHEGTTCSNVKGVMEDSLPIVMYSTHASPSLAMEAIGLSSSQSLVTDTSRVSDCTTESGVEARFYTVPINAIYDLNYIISDEYHAEYMTWEMQSGCRTSGETFDTDLMFTQGTRLFLQMPIEVDGVEQNRTLVTSTIAAAHDSSFIRGVIGEDTGFRGFVSGELTKKFFFDQVHHAMSRRAGEQGSSEGVSVRH